MVFKSIIGSTLLFILSIPAHSTLITTYGGVLTEDVFVCGGGGGIFGGSEVCSVKDVYTTITGDRTVRPDGSVATTNNIGLISTPKTGDFRWSIPTTPFTINSAYFSFIFNDYSNITTSIDYTGDLDPDDDIKVSTITNTDNEREEISGAVGSQTFIKESTYTNESYFNSYNDCHVVGLLGITKDYCDKHNVTTIYEGYFFGRFVDGYLGEKDLIDLATGSIFWNIAALDGGLGLNKVTLMIDYDLIEPASTTVPEPATIALISLGLAGIGFTRRKTKA